jgi:Putative transposase
MECAAASQPVPTPGSTSPPGEAAGKQGPEPSARRCANVDGFSVHANVSLPAHRRQKLENLCRYMLRPPLAVERLERLSSGRLAYRMKTPWRDGTTHVVLSDGELLESSRPWCLHRVSIWFAILESWPRRLNSGRPSCHCRLPLLLLNPADIEAPQKSKIRAREIIRGLS